MENLLNKIKQNFKLSQKDEDIISLCLDKRINQPRLEFVIDTMIEYHIQNEFLVPYVLFQFSKFEEKNADSLKSKLNAEQQKIYETFKILKDVDSLTKGGEAEDIRRMFVAICQDLRVVIVKFATILFDLQQIHNPMNDQETKFVNMVKEIFAPLAERLGLSKFKGSYEDLCFELLEPDAFQLLKNNALLKAEDNQKQMEITRKKLEQILEEIGKKGEIQGRQKHFSSVYKKLVRKNITLGKVYDLIAMRVLVDNVEDCYAVLGKIHAIYKPMPGRVKDYIANPKPNGYQSLHTTIIADNNRPLEIQIRTFDMHRQSEYGVAAHWIYKEYKRRGQNKFDQKMAWFRQVLENSNEMSSDEFLETLKVDLYGEAIVVQTPKGKILEFPLGATVVDFAYAIHSDVGNNCVGAKINGKIVPITTTLSNGDVIEILTNQHSKGPSRDWLSYVKTSSARSKIKAFFKSELKDENIRIGKAIVEQQIKARNLTFTKTSKEEYLLQVAKNMMIDELDVLYAEIGAGSLSAGSVVGRLINLYSKEKSTQLKSNTIRVERNKEGVLIDGDSGLLIRYAGCCSPVTGDEIIGYISHGRGVTIHRSECPNLKHLEQERLIKAEWQDSVVANFIATVKVVAENSNSVVNALNNASRALKNNLKAFAYKELNGELVFEITVQISNKDDLNTIINNFEQIKHVIKVYRSE